jgi:hypothetical protein
MQMLAILKAFMVITWILATERLVIFAVVLAKVVLVAVNASPNLAYFGFDRHRVASMRREREVFPDVIPNEREATATASGFGCPP